MAGSRSCTISTGTRPEIYWQALQAPEPFELEVPMRRNDGTFRWMQAAEPRDFGKTAVSPV